MANLSWKWCLTGFVQLVRGQEISDTELIKFQISLSYKIYDETDETN